MTEQTGIQTEDAIFAGGCFWCTEAVFSDVKGVLSIEPGYIGGSVDNPDYEAVCSGRTGHAEAVRIVFDPAQIAYRELVNIFFATHDPTTRNRQGNDIGTQYRSAIFCVTEAQLITARQVMTELGEQGIFPSAIVTELARAPRFWPAEVEHRDYFARHTDVPYCQYVIAPKVAKFREQFARWRRS